MVISFLFQILKSKHLDKFGSYAPGEPLFATAEEVLDIGRDWRDELFPKWK